jgi:hypothetical protein
MGAINLCIYWIRHENYDELVERQIKNESFRDDGQQISSYNLHNLVYFMYSDGGWYFYLAVVKCILECCDDLKSLF